MNYPFYAVCILLACGILNAVMPRLVRRDILFGVTTRAEFHATAEARRLLNRYSAHVLLLTLGCSLLAIWVAWMQVPRWSILLALLTIEIAGCTALYAVAHRDARRFHAPQSSWRVADLGAVRSQFLDSWLPVLIGVIALCAGFAFAFLLPDGSNRAPLFEGASAIAARWKLVSGGPWRVSFFLGMFTGGLIGPRLLCLAPARASFSKQRRIIQRAVGVVCVFFGIAGSLALAAAALGRPVPEHLLPFTFSLIALLTAVYWAILGRISARTEVALGPEGLPMGDHTQDDCWKWGLFYCNPQDMAILVPARCSPGYTFNFGRPATWLIIAALVALFLLPLVL